MPWIQASSNHLKLFYWLRKWLLCTANWWKSWFLVNDGECHPLRGSSDLVVLDDTTINSHCCIDILQDLLLLWTSPLFGCKSVFLENNAMPHNSYRTTPFLERSAVKVMLNVVQPHDLIFHCTDQTVMITLTLKHGSLLCLDEKWNLAAK